ncbi:MAG: outer membrane protein assembly factor BamE [Betaproteobacteria bacterium]
MPAAHPSHRMRLVFTLVLLLAGCKQVPVLPSLTPYKIDVQQGNYVTQEMVEKLKPGMTRSQVKFLLGTPLVVDPFRNDRWDYVYLHYKAGELAEQRRISVIFDQDKLKRVDGDVVAAGADAAKKEGAQTAAPAKPPAAAAAAEKKPAAGAAAAGTPAAKAETLQ